MPKYQRYGLPPTGRNGGQSTSAQTILGMYRQDEDAKRDQADMLARQKNAADLEQERQSSLMRQKEAMDQRQQARGAMSAKYGQNYDILSLPHEETAATYSMLWKGVNSGDYEFSEPAAKMKWDEAIRDLVSVDTDHILTPGQKEEAKEKVRQRFRELLVYAKPSQARRDAAASREIAEAEALKAKGFQRDPKSGALIPYEPPKAEKPVDPAKKEADQFIETGKVWEQGKAWAQDQIDADPAEKPDEKGKKRVPNDSEIVEQIKSHRRSMSNPTGLFNYGASGATGGTAGGATSPDGKYRWDGTKWVPL